MSHGRDDNRHAPVPTVPLSLYVHLPWCERKCPYCDFNSYEARSGLPERAYVDALLRDLASDATLIGRREVISVFLGGGTPSLFSGNAIARLLDGIGAQVNLATNAEITLEANPGSAEARRFRAFRAAGVNRLSIGVQSFRDPVLKAIGRVHDAAQALAAVQSARDAGFANLNIDLMYGLPDDTRDGALQDLDTALALRPQHLSWYQLTLEPDTAFHRRPPPLPEDEDIVAIETAGRTLLAAHAFERYEVSAYAQRGFRCAHNINYWTFGDYLGLGAGAHGKLTLSDRGGIVRRAKARNPRTWMVTAGTPLAVKEERVAASGQLALEFLMNALRLTDGVSVECFEQRTGQSIDAIREPLTEARRRGWLSEDAAQLKATASGYDYLNAMLGLFIDAPTAASA